MPPSTIQFNDGDAYDLGMGTWSRLVGETFLDWLAAPPGQRWLDVGCGTGAFTGLLARHVAPAELHGIDPAEAQLAFARANPALATARFHQGDAMALPFPADRFDAAVMALVIFFVPDPAAGVAELARVVRPGGTVAAYAWDMLGGGFPFAPIRTALREMGVTTPEPPSIGTDRMEALRALWADAGLQDVDTRDITVTREFPDFDTFWAASTLTGSIRPTVASLAPDELTTLQRAVRARLNVDAQGRIVHTAWANAIKGTVPA